MFEAKKFPQVRLYLTYDPKSGQTIEEHMMKYREKEYSLKDIEEFVQPYARKTPKELKMSE